MVRSQPRQEDEHEFTDSHSASVQNVPVIDGGHEHEFLGEEAEVEMDIDDNLIYVYEYCAHAPVISSVTDTERGETYTETGPRCEASRTTTIELSDPIYENVDRKVTQKEWEGMYEAVYEGIEDELIEVALTQFTGHGAVHEFSVKTTEWKNGQFIVEMTAEDREVHL